MKAIQAKASSVVGTLFRRAGGRGPRMGCRCENHAGEDSLEAETADAVMSAKCH